MSLRAQRSNLPDRVDNDFQEIFLDGPGDCHVAWRLLAMTEEDVIPRRSEPRDPRDNSRRTEQRS